MNFLYKSLQILRKEIHNSKCNIWSLGIIFYELLHGHTPWDGASR
jgi:serine/threonine protein kinase